MILSKLWFDLRWRFVFCAILVALGTLLLVFTFPLLRPFLLWLRADLSAEDWAKINPLLSSYRVFVDEGWFHKVHGIAAFAVILTLGGIMTERKNHTALFTLSLPVPRRKWVIYQSLFVFALVIALCCLASTIVLIGGVIYDAYYPFGRAIQGTFLLSLMTVPWIGVTLAVTSLTLEKTKTAVLIFGLWLIAGVLVNLQEVRIWMPQHLLDYFAGAPFPWQALIVILVVGIGGVILAIQQFESRDF